MSSIELDFGYGHIYLYRVTVVFWLFCSFQMQAAHTLYFIFTPNNALAVENSKGCRMVSSDLGRVRFQDFKILFFESRPAFGPAVWWSPNILEQF